MGGLLLLHIRQRKYLVIHGDITNMMGISHLVRCWIDHLRAKVRGLGEILYSIRWTDEQTIHQMVSWPKWCESSNSLWIHWMVHGTIVHPNSHQNGVFQLIASMYYRGHSPHFWSAKWKWKASMYFHNHLVPSPVHLIAWCRPDLTFHPCKFRYWFGADLTHRFNRHFQQIIPCVLSDFTHTHSSVPSSKATQPCPSPPP